MLIQMKDRHPLITRCKPKMMEDGSCVNYGNAFISPKDSITILIRDSPSKTRLKQIYPAILLLFMIDLVGFDVFTCSLIKGFLLLN